MSKAKSILVVKKIQQMQAEEYRKYLSAKEHNYEMDAMKHHYFYQKLQDICTMVEIELNTGYVRS
jgi:hypothetical protein